MPDEMSSTAGKRFSADLRQIREERGISIDEIHDDTRIARTLIKSFEEGRLYDHPTYNRVYLRSFVQAYAEAVDISPAAALAGLDAALDGSYEHDLAGKYVESSEQEEVELATEHVSDDSSDPSESVSPSSGGAPTAGGPEGRGGIVGPPRAVGEEAPEMGKEKLVAAAHEDSGEASTEPSEEETAGEENGEEDDSTSPPTESDPVPTEVHDPEPEPSVEKDERAEGAAEDLPAWATEESQEDDDETRTESQSEGIPSAEPTPSLEGASGTGIVGEPTKLGEGEKEEEPVEASSRAGTRPETSESSSTSASTRFFDSQSRQVYVTGLGIILLVAVLLGLGVAYLSAEETGEEPSSAAPDTTVSAAQSDTTDAEASSEGSGPPPANLTLGETLHVTVVATSNVSDIRIRRDSDLRRPYWIQEGEAAVFPFRRRITLENELSDVRLFLEGYPFPLSPQDTAGSVEITRSEAEAFADTLRGEPTTLTVPQDTIPAGGPVGE